MTTYKKRLIDKNGNTIYPDVGLNLDDVVYSDDPTTSVQDMVDPYTYSTDETIIGTWIDGKPIYRKVFVGTTSGGNTLSLSIGTDIVDTFVTIRALRTIASGTTDTIDAFYASSSDYFRSWGRKNGTANTIELRSPIASYSYIAIVEYTKTTD